MTFHALADQTGLAVNTIKNIAHDLIEELDRTKIALRTPVIMGIDEVSIAASIVASSRTSPRTTSIRCLEPHSDH